MANAKLFVTVNGGSPPLDINVAIFKDGVLETSFTKPKSFANNFTGITTGKYTLFISGFNPAGGNTDFNLTGVGITITRPAVIPINKTGIGYIVEFRFTI